MPSKNTVKLFAPDNYYHVYNRGVGKQTIFHDDEDYRFFLNLLKRHLDVEPHSDRQGRQYEHLSDKVELLAYCLMPNHFHLLFFLEDTEAITRLLRGISTAYSMYYNKKYKRVGSLFQGIYKASRITSDDYLQHISRYIHLNPKQYKSWQYSSLPIYMGTQQVGWLNSEKILILFHNNKSKYLEFLKNYESYKAMLDEIKHELADK